MIQENQCQECYHEEIGNFFFKIYPTLGLMIGVIPGSLFWHGLLGAIIGSAFFSFVILLLIPGLSFLIGVWMYIIKMFLSQDKNHISMPPPYSREKGKDDEKRVIRLIGVPLSF